MDNGVLIVVLDAKWPSKELAEKIEEIRRISGVLGVRTIQNIAEDVDQPQYGGAGRTHRTEIR